MSEALSESSRYLATLDRDHRRATGVVYTPDAIVELVLDQEFGTDGAPEGPVLDPACGAGVFPTAVVARIASRLEDQGVQITETQGRRRFLADVERFVWALDVDPGAVEVTLREVRALIERLTPGPMSADFLAGNIVAGDFLQDGLFPLGKAYRHVVGNPPYVPVDRIEASDRATYRKLFTSAVGRTDLYYLFMEQSARVLQEGGTWTLITPDKFLSNRTGQALRTFLRDSGAIRTLSRFTSHSVFRDAATVPCITTWVKGGEQAAADQHRIELGPDRTPNVTTEARVPRAAFQDSTWTFHSTKAGSLLSAITADHPRLVDHALRISAGPATGYNPAFIVDAKIAAGLDEELVHPTVRGRDIGRFGIEESGAFMVVPYVWGADGQARLVDLDAYPRTRRWLAKHRRNLKERHSVRRWGKCWWDLHDPITLPLHETEKLLVPDVARQNRFAVDPGRFVPQHSAYYLIPRALDADVLAAVLNSAPVELVMRSTAPLVKDGFSRYRRQYLLELPVPTPSAELAIQIGIAARGETPELAAELAATLFNVDAGDVRLALDHITR
ncbi:Eco57I restriction-modification methylase domain-containing protein [Nocardioides acrostichi]|uniref:site-specific DNA-methyltransferase (adenine-specific) n=1 Tax=Nocardioides acrostichi TaxID=2784339 RepID=A0A930YDI1_9ACTN|nr:Eco57I restriction-modification methylase domain-containing protein [Nocardioides acrostichi]MBF4162504.1 Eco57I restriction-modification methylase domain-containing protein [Nocardioides acrostichi]